MGKFSNALGIWDVEIDGVKFELKPNLADVRKFRTILVDNGSNKHKSVLFDKFASFMIELIKKDESEEPEEEIKSFVEVHLNTLFEDAMVAFKWTSKEELEKSKKESMADLKKKISND